MSLQIKKRENVNTKGKRKKKSNAHRQKGKIIMSTVDLGCLCVTREERGEQWEDGPVSGLREQRVEGSR